MSTLSGSVFNMNLTGLSWKTIKFPVIWLRPTNILMKLSENMCIYFRNWVMISMDKEMVHDTVPQ